MHAHCTSDVLWLQMKHITESFCIGELIFYSTNHIIGEERCTLSDWFRRITSSASIDSFRPEGTYDISIQLLVCLPTVVGNVIRLSIWMLPMLIYMYALGESLSRI